MSTISQGQQEPSKKYTQLFKGLGELDGKYSIQLEEGAELHSLSVPHLVTIHVPLMKKN